MPRLQAFPLLLALSLLSGCSRDVAAGTVAPAPAAESTAAQRHNPPQQTQANVPNADASHERTSIVRTETVANVARRFLSRTKYMTVAELETAIRDQNALAPKQLWLKPGTTLVIPGIEPQPIVEHPRNDPADMEVKAIYLTGATAGSANGLKMIEHWREVGGNAVVFDIKDSDGLTSIPFEHPLAPHNRHNIENLPKFVRWLHQHDMHAIARVALFRDEHIARDFPRLAVQSRSALAAGKNPAPWNENGKQVWTDTSNPEVQAYDIALAKYVAQSGVDEVQFDYVRFPAEGAQKDAKFAFEAVHPEWKRADVIADFLDRAYKELHPEGVLLSLDVFGVMAWQRQVDLAHTGQDIVRMSKHADVISPMIYPSHFFNMDGYTGKDGHPLPGDAPEHFIDMSMQRFDKITAGTGVVVRPWLQAFGWKTRTYSPEYVMKQIKVSKQDNGIGFLLWNARNDYAKPYVAMREMTGNPQSYFETTSTLAEKRRVRQARVAAVGAPVTPAVVKTSTSSAMPKTAAPSANMSQQ
jgi:hypothetical protein